MVEERRRVRCEEERSASGRRGVRWRRGMEFGGGEGECKCEMEERNVSQRREDYEVCHGCACRIG